MRNRRLQEVVCLAHDDTAYKMEPSSKPEHLTIRAHIPGLSTVRFPHWLHLHSLHSVFQHTEPQCAGNLTKRPVESVEKGPELTGSRGFQCKAGVCLCTKQKRTQGGRTQLC